MTLRWRLVLLVVLATGLPVVTGLLVTRQLVREVLEVGLSPPLDAALEAGVRPARDGFRAERGRLEADARDLAAVWAAAPADLADRRARLAAAAAARLGADDRLGLGSPAAERDVLQPGTIPVADPDRAPDAPPGSIETAVELAGGWRLELVRPLAAAWQDDAALVAGTLQVVRGLRLQQSRLERIYWLPFLGIFLLALAVGVAAATRLGRGITDPVSRLVGGTEQVAAGRWDVQLPVARRDELGRLTTGFNTMVRTLDQQSRRLVDLEKMAGWREMARALAHEVKNPLTPIQLTVEEMRARYPGGDPEYQALLDECTRIVVEEVESLRSVVARFREFSRPVELAPVAVDLGQLVRDVATLQRDLQVEVAIADGLEPVVVDPDRLRQVLMNLAENAREATRGLPAPRLALAVHDEDGDAVVTVEDNGPGVPPAERERIFEPYRSGKKGGLGLGLALVKGIVLAHGGTIAVESGRWGGACFVMRLPRTAGSATGESSHA